MLRRMFGATALIAALGLLMGFQGRANAQNATYTNGAIQSGAATVIAWGYGGPSSAVGDFYLYTANEYMIGGFFTLDRAGNTAYVGGWGQLTQGGRTVWVQVQAQINGDVNTGVGSVAVRLIGQWNGDPSVDGKILYSTDASEIGQPAGALGASTFHSLYASNGFTYTFGY